MFIERGANHCAAKMFLSSSPFRPVATQIDIQQPMQVIGQHDSTAVMGGCFAGYGFYKAGIDPGFIDLLVLRRTQWR